MGNAGGTGGCSVDWVYVCHLHLLWWQRELDPVTETIRTTGNAGAGTDQVRETHQKNTVQILTFANTKTDIITIC